MTQFTQREHLFVEDLLHMEELCVKEAADFAQHCTDPQLQRLCMDIASRSERQFRTLLSHVNRAQGQSQGLGQQQQQQNQFTQAGPAFYPSQGTPGYGYNQQ